MYFIWRFVTDLGDSAVTLPLDLLTGLYLLLAGRPRSAAAFAIAIAAGALAIALLKLGLESCGQRLLGTTLVNPSGHVALSTMTYGALALVLGAALAGWRRRVVCGGFMLLIAGIAASRFTLHAHNLGEVLVGLATGLAALAIFDRLRGEPPAVGFRAGRLAAAALVLAIAMHGTRWPIEEQIRAMVMAIRASAPQCACIGCTAKALT